MKSQGIRKMLGSLAFAALLTATMGVGARQAGQTPPPIAPGAKPPSHPAPSRPPNR